MREQLLEQEMAGNANGFKPTVLIVDDQYRTFRSLPRFISSELFSSLWVADEQKGLKALEEGPEKIWIIIVDLKSSGMGGGGFLQKARQIAPHAAVLVTAPLGAFLYQGGAFFEVYSMPSKHEINTLLRAIMDKTGAFQTRVADSGRQWEDRERFGAIVGRSRSINEIYQFIRLMKDSSATVLIQGETGTGKELIARTIHETSPRKKGPFVAINCGAIPASLMESELFGHERGAFTSALCQRKGKFEVAGGGTLFLDEIGELDKELQVKLLRVLQEREFQRVGGNATYKTDVRVIAATSLDLRKAVLKGEFREDLFYRLNVLPINVPALRDRKEDLPLLLDYFIEKSTREMGRAQPTFANQAWKRLLRYDYPGNIRELANIVERLLVICPCGKVTLDDLPEEVREETEVASDPIEHLKELPHEGIPLQEVEKELILKTLVRTSGNKHAAARMLGITRRLLYLRLSQYGIRLPR